MTTKTLINSVGSCVHESLYGFSKLHPNLKFFKDQKVVVNIDSLKKNEVCVISGGGSGHEPFPVGYVGNGMLAASVSGEIFESPPCAHILQAIRSTSSGGKEVLLIVPNYTGDVLNFGLAAELAKSEGIPVDCVIVGEDIAQEVYGIYAKTGKRGMCGLVIAIKIAGYLSSVGESMSALKKFLEEAILNMATMGVCLSPCSKPGFGLLFTLGEEEIEVGLGVHGEAGVDRRKMMTAGDTVEMLLNFLIKSLNVVEGDEVVAMINNLGCLTYMEQWLLAGEVEKQLRKRSIKVRRLYAGCFFTSLNMAGVQICILKLTGSTKSLFLQALDYQTSAFAWPHRSVQEANSTWEEKSRDTLTDVENTFRNCFSLLPSEACLLKECLAEAAFDLIQAESRLNLLDSVCGDGDCGSSFKRIGQCVLSKVTSSDCKNPALLFFELSLKLQEVVGGTSGALYGLFFKGISDELKRQTNVNGEVISKCWRGGVDIVKKYSAARVGDRTMLDSLETACEVFEKRVKEKPEAVAENFKLAVEEAETSCRKTKSMKASAGRASYTSQTQQTNEDAGAYAVCIWLSAVLKMLEKS